MPPLATTLLEIAERIKNVVGIVTLNLLNKANSEME
jgi:hypothetical protein